MNALISSNIISLNNTTIGNNGLKINTAINNTAIGSDAGNANFTGSSNTFLGKNANSGSNNISISTAIGYGSSVNKNNQIVLGTSSEMVTIPGYLKGTQTYVNSASNGQLSWYFTQSKTLNITLNQFGGTLIFQPQLTISSNGQYLYYVSYENSGFYINKSTDGTTVTRACTSYILDTIKKIVVSNNGQNLLLNGSYSLYYSTNFGVTIVPIHSSTINSQNPTFFNDIAISYDGLGMYAVANNTLFYSQNAGTTWQSSTLGTNSTYIFYSISHYKPTNTAYGIYGLYIGCNNQLITTAYMNGAFTNAIPYRTSTIVQNNSNARGVLAIANSLLEEIVSVIVDINNSNPSIYTFTTTSNAWTNSNNLPGIISIQLYPSFTSQSQVYLVSDLTGTTQIAYLKPSSSTSYSALPLLSLNAGSIWSSINFSYYGSNINGFSCLALNGIKPYIALIYNSTIYTKKIDYTNINNASNYLKIGSLPSGNNQYNLNPIVVASGNNQIIYSIVYNSYGYQSIYISNNNTSFNLLPNNSSLLGSKLYADFFQNIDADSGGMGKNIPNPILVNASTTYDGKKILLKYYYGQTTLNAFLSYFVLLDNNGNNLNPNLNSTLVNLFRCQPKQGLSSKASMGISSDGNCIVFSNFTFIVINGQPTGAATLVISLDGGNTFLGYNYNIAGSNNPAIYNFDIVTNTNNSCSIVAQVARQGSALSSQGIYIFSCSLNNPYLSPNKIYDATTTPLNISPPNTSLSYFLPADYPYSNLPSPSRYFTGNYALNSLIKISKNGNTIVVLTPFAWGYGSGYLICVGILNSNTWNWYVNNRYVDNIYSNVNIYMLDENGKNIIITYYLTNRSQPYNTTIQMYYSGDNGLTFYGPTSFFNNITNSGAAFTQSYLYDSNNSLSLNLTIVPTTTPLTSFNLLYIDATNNIYMLNTNNILNNTFGQGTIAGEIVFNTTSNSALSANGENIYTVSYRNNISPVGYVISRFSPSDKYNYTISNSIGEIIIKKIVVSATGKYILLNAICNLYFSNNYGDTFTIITSTSIAGSYRIFNDIAITYNEQTFYAIDNTNIYSATITNNILGLLGSWSSATTNITPNVFLCLACSNDYAYIGASNGNFYAKNVASIIFENPTLVSTSSIYGIGISLNETITAIDSKGNVFKKYTNAPFFYTITNTGINLNLTTNTIGNIYYPKISVTIDKTGKYQLITYNDFDINSSNLNRDNPNNYLFYSSDSGTTWLKRQAQKVKTPFPLTSNIISYARISLASNITIAGYYYEPFIVIEDNVSVIYSESTSSGNNVYINNIIVNSNILPSIHGTINLGTKDRMFGKIYVSTGNFSMNTCNFGTGKNAVAISSDPSGNAFFYSGNNDNDDGKTYPHDDSHLAGIVASKIIVDPSLSQPGYISIGYSYIKPDTDYNITLVSKDNAKTTSFIMDPSALGPKGSINPEETFLQLGNAMITYDESGNLYVKKSINGQPSNFVSLTGTQGPPGVNSIYGATGPQGTQGYTGYIGPTGVYYDIGATGSQGIQGIQGSIGSTGIIGDEGFIGFTGNQGDYGVTGPDGEISEIGATGHYGFTGFFGIEGEKGPIGDTGIQGDTGPQGYTGFNGLPGIYFTIGATGLLGIQGNQGSQGRDGEYGYNGIQGYTGMQNWTGAQGIKGSQGSQGSQGLKGNQGSQGSIGNTGSVKNGNTGFAGPTGYNGLQGLIGHTGDKGKTGPTGLSGLIGPTGITGTTGATGYVGIYGFTGLVGLSPNTGATGIQGYMGIAGFTGPQGSINNSMYGGEFDTSGVFQMIPNTTPIPNLENSLYDSSNVFILSYNLSSNNVLYSSAYNDILYRIDVIYKYLNQKNPTAFPYPSSGKM